MKKLFILVFIHLVSFTTIAENNLSVAVEQKINQFDPSLNIGVKVTNLDKDKIVFEKNADRYFVPASTLKFITIVSLIDYFGLDYKFTNKVLSVGPDYYLDIHDPEFGLLELDAMLAAIAKHSGGAIKGNIYISDRDFTVPPIMRDKTHSDTIYCYGAPVTTVHINKNCSRVEVDVSKVGQKITVKAPDNFPYIIKNNAVTIEKNNFDRLNVSIKGNQYIIDGTLSISTGGVVIGAVANDNLLQVKHYVKKLLLQHKIKLSGKISYGTPVPQKVKEVASFSKNMLEISSIAMKKSDNFITDYLLAELATQKNQSEWELATSSMKKIIMEKFNVDLLKSQIKDGSGISRLNLITVNQHNDFLKAVSRKPYFETIKGIMAQPGDDCTLKERLQGVKNIYTKTGTLSNISGLIGYFYNENNELHSFVIMSSNFYGDSPAAKLEEDLIRLFMDPLVTQN